MSRTPGAQRGHIWTKAENDILRIWVDKGMTVKEMVKLSGDYFSEPVNDAAIRNHLNYLGVKYIHERNVTRTTPEMRNWMRTHYTLPLLDLTRIFNEVFHVEFTSRQVYKLAYRVGNLERGGYMPLDQLAMEWEEATRRISPDKKMKPKHWLWRYYRLDENRRADGVVFRGTR